MIQDRASVFPKAFTELTFGLSDVLKVAPYVYKIFGLARYGVGDFSRTKNEATEKVIIFLVSCCSKLVET